MRYKILEIRNKKMLWHKSSDRYCQSSDFQTWSNSISFRLIDVTNIVSLSWLLMQRTEELSGNSPSYCLHKQQWDSQGKVTLPWEMGSFFFSRWNKQSDQYQSGGGKHFFWVIDNSPPLREANAGTQGRSLDPKSWGTPDYWFAFRLTFSHLPYIT